MKRAILFGIVALIATGAMGCAALMDKDSAGYIPEPQISDNLENFEKDPPAQVSEQTETPAPAPEATGPFGTRAASVYMPLNLGNTWVYDRFFLGETGETKIMIVSRDEEGYYVDNFGGRLMLTSMGLRDESRYMLLAPLEENKRWLAQVAPNIAEHFEITEDNASVTVPAGQFEHCLIVTSTTRISKTARMVNTVIYAPGVGIISMASELVDNQGRSRKQVGLKLTSYEFPKAK